MFGNEKFFSSGASASSGTFYPYEINNSLKFEDGDSSYLSRTFPSAGNRRTWTWSGWVKRGNLGSNQALFSSGTSSPTYSSLRFLSTDKIQFFVGGAATYSISTTAVYRDTSSWYHILFVFDVTETTASDRCKLYVNGVQQTLSGTFPTNTNWEINNTYAHGIGAMSVNSTFSQPLDGYMTEINFIDGTALTPSSFGETKEGIWVPKDPTGLTYGTNGFRLPFTETTTANGFNTVTYSGNGATQSVEGVGFQPDFVWVKERTSTSSHVLTDSVRGVTKGLNSNTTDPENTNANYVTSFNADGFTVGSSGAFNASTDDYVAWCWGGGTNDKTYTVTVVNDGGNKYRFDGHGTSSIALNLTEGATYTFNYPSAHPLRFSTTSDGTHNSGSEYTTGVTHVSSTQTTITVASGAPVLYYYCSQHSGMGGQVNTNTTDGPTHAEGTILSRVKPNADYGFSIVSYTGTGSAATVGHGLGVAPKMIIIKDRGDTSTWIVYTEPTGNDNVLVLASNQAASSTGNFSSTSPTSTVFSQGGGGAVGASSSQYIAYCFADVTGYQKIGTYTGNGSTTGPTVTLGFRPAFLLIKRTDSTGEWILMDNTRHPSNPNDLALFARLNYAEASSSSYEVDFNSDGFQLKNTNSSFNASSGTYIYLAIADTRDALFTSDASGNGNHWTPNALQHSDVMPDTPTDGFSTFNLLNKYSGITLTEGNLTAKGPDNAWRNVDNTIHMSSGKWYWEIYINNVSSHQMHGIVPSVRANGRTNFHNDIYPGSYSDEWGYRNNGYLYNSASPNNSWGSTYTTGDVLGFALDMDAGTLDITKNGASTGSQITGISGTYRTCATLYGSSSKASYNFGQDSSFNANKIAQGNADSNGKGDFYYAPPSGHLAICNANLPNPAIDPNAGENPEDYFNTVLYTGNGSTNNITGVGFSPDFVWVKSRNTAGEAQKVVDSVRGAGLTVFPSSTSTEIDYSGVGLNSFDTDGFTVSHSAANNQWNVSGRTYVAWNWLAGSTGVSNTDGTITSTVSANTEAGFSIVGYTGTGANATVGHGLGVAPKMVIVKRRTGSIGSWVIYHSAIAADAETDYLSFTTDAALDNHTVWNDTAPTSNVFSIGTAAALNANTATYISYCFAEKEGYSKFGGYTGNGSTDGPFVYTGFRPSFVMVKRTNTTGSWFMLDAKRDENNPVENLLLAHSTGGEITASPPIFDFTSNGFKHRSTGSSVNASGSTYIYMAFAEQPFKYSNAR